MVEADPNLVLQSYSICAMIFFINHFWTIQYTSDRSKHLPEDYAMLGDGKTNGTPDKYSKELRKRKDRILQNSIENLSMHVALITGAVFVTVFKGQGGLYTPLSVLIWVVAGLRTMYNVFYVFGMNHPLPFRSLAWGFSWFANVGILIISIMAAFADSS